MVLAALLLPVGCSVLDYSADFAENELFYADVPFRTKAPGDRPVFVTPIVDARVDTVLPVHEGGFPIAYGNDNFWERPVPEMFAEVLDRQLADSGLFPAVSEYATKDTLILKPTLVSFTTATMEQISGSRSVAEVGVRIEVLGPAGENGERPLWHDQVYGNRQLSERKVRPVSPYRLIGRALQLTMTNILGGLDGSNVARSHVPVEIVMPSGESKPAEASVGR